ncbi:MAG: cob(I)yrinic acid a,c-diamide adenosyltransferase [Limnobacter sp.]|nr:cob(I)yrinic acid a,c-diamide adenosyltransferase [Limnobacter sp.]
MAKRLTAITTRTGDDGTTGLATGERLPKCHLRIHTMGEVDELNSHIGLLLTEPVPEPLRTELVRIQHDLFDLGAALCMPGFDIFSPQAVERLDALIKRLNKPLPSLQEFILPGGSKAAAYAHIARTVARRAERSLVALLQQQPDPDVQQTTPGAPPASQPAASENLLLYLNRLSDLLFVAARWIHLQQGVTDVQWEKGHRENL